MADESIPKDLEDWYTPYFHHGKVILVPNEVIERIKNEELESTIRTREFEKPEISVAHDPITHPAHYTSHPSGIECITITEHMNFCVGNAIKYLWRAGHKNSSTERNSSTELEDLKKAHWYINREIQRLQGTQK